MLVHAPRSVTLFAQAAPAVGQQSASPGQAPAPRGRLAAVSQVADIVSKISQAAAIIAGGLWGYYKFVKGRVFESKLELSATGALARSTGCAYLNAGIQLKNLGLSRVAIQREGTVVTTFAHSSNDYDGSIGAVSWTRLQTSGLFEKHLWIEPGETITDMVVLQLPDDDSRVYRIAARVVAHGNEWNAEAWAVARPEES